MDYIAKIVQIIKYEDKKNYGFIDYPGHDYINLQPVELEEERQKSYVKNIRLINIIALVQAFIFIPLDGVYLHMGWVGTISGLLFIGALIGTMFINRFIERRVFNKYWYFEAPVPVPKGHNYQVGDIVDISIQLKKVN